VANHSGRSILLNPVSGEPMVPPLQVRCISKIEAFAEKFRAAMTRREVAIRDFYDLDYAVRTLRIQPQDAALVELVRQKLAISGGESLDLSEKRLTALRQQLEPRLKPVLRERDYLEFDLERAFQTVLNMAKGVVEPR
jgi:Nucleotidyl transferase AbiEii toxin, Type IV TA system